MDIRKANREELEQKIEELSARLSEAELKGEKCENDFRSVIERLPCVVLRFNANLQFINANSAMAVKIVRHLSGQIPSLWK